MHKTQKVLIIDDKADIRLSAKYLLSKHNFQVLEADSPDHGLAIIHKENIDLVLLDMNFTRDTTSGEEGIDCLKKIKAINADIAVVAITAWSFVDLVVKALKNGATDFIEKPWDNQRLLQIVQQALKLEGLEKQNRLLKQQIDDFQHTPQLIAYSASMKLFKAQLDEVTDTPVTILLTGENGTGKSTIARYIHQNSLLKNNPLISVNMGAIAENLFESEMFGHTKGAFTNAYKERIGRFEMADSGTLFLDEIANIPHSQQAKLLRVLESGEFEMVGSSKTKRANVRLISATNADFSTLIANNDFRQDLYFRLNTVELHVPSLKDRKEDIPYLAQHFFNNVCRKYHKPGRELSSNALDKLQQHSFPGNLRELSHIIERALLLNRDDCITADHLNLNDEAKSNIVSNDQLPLMTIEQAERKLLNMALTKAQGQSHEAANLLGISKSSIYRRMEKYNIVAKHFLENK